MNKKMTVKEMNEMVFDSKTLNGGVIYTKDRYYKIRHGFSSGYVVEGYGMEYSFKTKAQAMKYVRERYM